MTSVVSCRVWQVGSVDSYLLWLGLGTVSQMSSVRSVRVRWQINCLCWIWEWWGILWYSGSMSDWQLLGPRFNSCAVSGHMSCDLNPLATRGWIRSFGVSQYKTLKLSYALKGLITGFSLTSCINTYLGLNCGFVIIAWRKTYYTRTLEEVLMPLTWCTHIANHCICDLVWSLCCVLCQSVWLSVAL